MIFSFTGAQSTGKTTLLNHLHKCNGDDLTQLLIMSEHVRNIYKNKADRLSRGMHMIFDRCALDGIVYSQWLLNESKISRRCYEACDLIYEELKDKYDIIFYTSPDDVQLVDDGERSVNVKFRNDIINTFNAFLERGYDGKVVVLEGSVEERLKTIKSTLDKHNIDIKI